jgi:hypothetical protein
MAAELNLICGDCFKFVPMSDKERKEKADIANEGIEETKISSDPRIQEIYKVLAEIFEKGDIGSRGCEAELGIRISKCMPSSECKHPEMFKTKTV